MPSIAPNGKSQYGRGLVEDSWKGMKIIIGKARNGGG